jgi:hypothetical protein
MKNSNLKVTHRPENLGAGSVSAGVAIRSAPWPGLINLSVMTGDFAR